MRWLDRHTPTGAPVYSCTTWLPITLPPVPRFHGRPEGRSVGELEAIEAVGLEVGDQPMDLTMVLERAGLVKPPRIARAMVRMVAPDPLRRDGYPAAWHGRVAEDGYGYMWSLSELQRAGSGARALIAAAYHDVMGMDLRGVERSIGLQESDQPDRSVPRPWSADRQPEQPRRPSELLTGARAYVKEGRGLWCALGAWPWAHAEPLSVKLRGRTRPSVRLPAEWWTAVTFSGPLAQWHRQALREAEQQTRGAQRIADTERAHGDNPRPYANSRPPRMGRP